MSLSCWVFSECSDGAGSVFGVLVAHLVLDLATKAEITLCAVTDAGIELWDDWDQCELELTARALEIIDDSDQVMQVQI